MNDVLTSEQAPNTAEIPDRLTAMLKRPMVITEAQTDVIALWISHIYGHMQVQQSPCPTRMQGEQAR